jgi:hypothetical protein
MNDEFQNLNKRLSEEIFFAGRATPGSQEAQDAYRRISDLEEQLARLKPTDVDGAMARVGAVSAALRAGDWLRASRLVEEFIVGAPDDVAMALRELDREADAAARLLEEPYVKPIRYKLVS